MANLRSFSLPSIFLLIFFMRATVVLCLEIPMIDCDISGTTGEDNTDPPTQATKDEIARKLRVKAIELKGYPSKYIPFKQDDGSFSDIVYDDETNSLWPREHGKRVSAFVYVERNEAALDPWITKAYEYMLSVPRVRSTTYDSSKHWEHVIAFPLAIWPGIIIARDTLTCEDPSCDDLIIRLLDRFWTDTDYGPVWNMTCRYDKNSGGNFGPRAIAALAEASLRDNLQVFVDELKVRWREELVTRDPYMGNGFVWDGCFHQHNMLIPSHHQNGTGLERLKLIYNSGYGKEFLKHMATVGYVLDATDYELELEAKNGLFNAFFECHQWLYKGGTADPASIGRFLDNGQRLTYYSVRDAIYLPMLDLDRMNFRNAEVKSALDRYKNVRPADEHVLKGNRNFFLSDMMAHQRQDFMVALRMMSNRTCRPETKPTRNENKRGYFLGDGFLTLIVDNDLGSRNNELFRAYNWTRVPGVTNPYTNNVTQMQLSPKYLVHSYNDHDFVGGVSDRHVGMAAMVYARPSVQITAKKSFVFYDKVILAMGSDIRRLPNLEEGRYVATTLNQVPYNGSYAGGRNDIYETVTAATDPHHEWSSDLNADTNQWLHHKLVGYISLKSDGKLMASVEQQQDFISMDVFSAWIDHGTLINGPATYSYVILPNATIEETKEYAKNPTVTVITLTEDVHDACDTYSKIEAVALFEQGCFSIKECLGLDSTSSAQICTGSPVMVLAKLAADATKCNSTTTIGSPTTSILELSIADPTHQLVDMTVTFNLDGTPHDKVVVLPGGNMKGNSTSTCFLF